MGDEIHVRSGDLIIEKNFIADDEILLQISNISEISVIEQPEKKFQVWTIIFLFVGVILFAKGNSNENYYLIGLILVFGELLYTWINILVNMSRKKNICV